MHKRLYYALILCFLSFHLGAGTWYGKDTASLAAIKDPVIDLFLQIPLQKNPPVSPRGYGDSTCLRAHQGLANEVATIVATDGDHVQIAFDNVVYGLDEITKQPLSTFWTNKKHLIFFKDLADEVLEAFPGPWAVKNNSLILIRPWKKYSLGTHFVRDIDQDTKYVYGAKIFNSQWGIITTLKIPKKYARLEGVVPSRQARKYFVNLANDIVDYASRLSADNIIPYVWGGSSYVHEYQDDAFSLKNGWVRPEKHMPATGYDCSELVLRLAQTSGIAYFNKTTGMLYERGKEIGPHDILEEGDLIWCPGHVMIVSNIPRNELIEARGYGMGFGKVQRLPLSACFVGIKNYHQLRKACYAKQLLQVLKKDGSVSEEVKEFKFFKLL